MLRKIITINEDKCNGCGLCVAACHEGALGVVHGKARLLRDSFCDGMGDCLPECPQGAIAFTEREAPAYDAAAVAANKRPAMRGFPIQLKLVSPTAPQFRGCDLLVAADCTAFMCDDFKREFATDRAVVIGCPKLDGTDYSDKLAEIIAANDVCSVTVTRMEVPCCGGLVRMVESAIAKSGRELPLEVVTITTGGERK